MLSADLLEERRGSVGIAWTLGLCTPPVTDSSDAGGRLWLGDEWTIDGGVARVVVGA